MGSNHQKNLAQVGKATEIWSSIDLTTVVTVSIRPPILIHMADGGIPRKVKILPYKHAFTTYGAAIAWVPSQIAYSSHGTAI